MRPKNIELHIEELVLEGFEKADSNRIAEAIERELTHLFTEMGVSPSLAIDGEINRLDGGTVQVAPGIRPEAIGARVARVVYQGLKK